MVRPTLEPRGLARRREPDPAPVPGSRWPRIFGLALAAVLLLVPAFGYAALHGWVPAPVVNAATSLFVHRQAGALPWRSDQPVNMLVMGLQVGGASVNPLTDSMMVASYQPSDGSVGLLSVPRDLWVEIPGHGQGRINEAFEDGGAGTAMLTVAQNLGVPVNYYAIISYEAFEKFVDDAGGLTVDVPREIDDPTFPAADEIHYEPFKITKGTHHLNGHEALRYARTRHADSDFGRASRQQQVLLALKNQMLSPGNWLKLPLLLRDAQAMVRTNFPLDQAAGLALKVLRAPKEKVRSAVLGYENQAVEGFTTSGGADVLAPNKEAVAKIAGDLFGPSLSLIKTDATIRVDNGNGYPGAAGQFSRILTGMGAKVSEPGDADRKDYDVSRVKAYTTDSAKLRTARLIAGMLDAAVEQGNKPGEPDIVVMLGRDYAPFVKFSEKDWEAATKPQ